MLDYQRVDQIDLEKEYVGIWLSGKQMGSAACFFGDCDLQSVGVWAMLAGSQSACVVQTDIYDPHVNPGTWHIL